MLPFHFFDLTILAVWYVLLGARDVGQVLVAGLGAVANGAIWALSRDQQLTGHLTLVDPETITVGNLQRYVLAGVADPDAPKTQIASRALESSQLFTEGFATTLEFISDQRGGLNEPTIMISVDNVDGRRSAQALLPRLLINGWTGDHGLGASWHEFSRDAACLACCKIQRGKGLSATEQAARVFGLSAERAAFLWVSPQGLNTDDIDSCASALGVPSSEIAQWRGRKLGGNCTRTLSVEQFPLTSAETVGSKWCHWLTNPLLQVSSWLRNWSSAPARS